MIARGLCMTFIVLALLGQGELQAVDLPAQRWIYLQQNLQVADNIPKIEAILRRGAKAGYNGVVLADYKLNILDRVVQQVSGKPNEESPSGTEAAARDSGVATVVPSAEKL